MQRRIILFAMLLGLTLALPAVVPAAVEKTVCVIAIREDITANTTFLIRRGLREASAKNAAAIILDMDTNGGRLDATEEIVKLLGHATVPTYTYVNIKAFSAGAIIANATDKIFMAPGSVIGAATPIKSLPGVGITELPAAEREKMNSATRALVRTTAQQKGHNPAVFEAMVDKDCGLTIDDEVILPKGKLLTLTNEEAARVAGKTPKPILSAGTMKSLDDVLAKVDLKNATTFDVKPFGFELLARGITMVSPLLILVGFIAIYMEMKAPGLGVPAVVGIACFGIYFLGYFVAGLAGWEEMALFVVGFGLIGLEVFVLPGFGVAGIAGILAVLVALVLAMTEHLPGGPVLPKWDHDLQWSIAKVGFSFGASLLGFAVLARYLPETRLFKKFELSATTSTAQGYSSSTGAAKTLLGATGIAETNLRPAGKGRFGTELVDVVTEGELLPKGTSIRITQVEGSRVVVTRAAGD